MSLQTNKPALEGSLQPGLAPFVRKPSATPVFKPEFERSLRLHPRAAAVAACLALLLILAYAFRQRPLYEAESLVKIEPTETRVINDNSSGLFDSGRYDSYLQQQMLTAARPDILAAAVASLPPATRRQWGGTDTAANARLATLLKTQRVGNSYQVSFTLRGEDPEATASTLNAIVATYLAAGRKDALSLSGGRAQILLEEKARLQTELDSARAEQARLSATLGMANPGIESGNPYDSQLVGLRTELAGAREAHDIAAAQLASVSGAGAAPASGLTAAAEESIAGDAGLSSMKATISQRRAVLAGQMAGLTPENPIYRQDQEEIANLDRSLSTMTTEMRDKAARRLQDKLRTDLARTGDVESRLNAQLSQQTFAATSAAPRLQRAAELSLDIQRLMTRYATVDDALRTLKLDDSGPGAVHLALAATAPLNPVPSRRNLILLLALPLALLAGLFAAVFARKRDPRVYLGRDVEDVLGFSPIAVLPAAGEVSESVMGEHILRLAGGIESAFRTAHARVFVFTSAGAALDLAELTRPLAARLEQLGLDQITVGAHALLDPGFTPQMRMNARTGHGEGVIAANLAALEAEHTLVLIEAPALLTSAETECVVRSSDATILIARSGSISRGDLLESAHLLERLRVRGVAAVLEGLELRNADPGFRKAVAALDRRHRDAPQDPRPARVSGQRPKAGAAYEAPRFASVAAVKSRPADREPLVADSGKRAQTASPLTEPQQEPEAEPGAPPALFSAADLDLRSEPAAGPIKPVPIPAPVSDSPVSPAPATIEPIMTEPVSTFISPNSPEAKPEDPEESASGTGWLRRLISRGPGEPASLIPPTHVEDDGDDRGKEPRAPAVGAPPPALADSSGSREAAAAGPGSLADGTLEAVAAGESPIVSEPALPDVAPDVGPAPPEPALLVEESAPPLAEVVELPLSEPAFETSLLSGPAGAEPLPRVEEAAAAAPDPADTQSPQLPVPSQIETEQPPALPSDAQAPLAEPDAAVSSSEPEPVRAVSEPQAPPPAPSTPALPDPARPAFVQAASVAHPDFWERAILDPGMTDPGILDPAILESALPSAEAALSSPSEELYDETARTAEPPANAVPVPVPAVTPAGESPSLRTGRWEPIQPLRPDVAPWRDRRISGASAIRPFGPERRFNWAQHAALALGSLPASPSQPARVGPAPQPGLELVPREPRLTRPWALLSRFGDLKAEANPKLSESGEDGARPSGEDGFDAPLRASRRS